MRRRVLIVDDEPTMRKAIARELGDQFEVLTADGCPEAFALFQDGEPLDAVIADFDLSSRCTGYQVLAAATQLYPHAARLLVSAIAGSSMVQDVMDLGVADRLLAKPWKHGMMLSVLLDELRARRDPPSSRDP